MQNKPPDENEKKKSGKLQGNPYENVVPIAPGTLLPKPPTSELVQSLVFAPALAEPLPPIKWLCEQFAMAPGRPVLVAGYGGIGKTFAAQETALCVAAGLGKMWGSVPLQSRGKVVHVDFEQGLWITRWRYQRLARGLGVDLASLGDNLSVCSLPSVYLTSPKAEEELTALATGRELVIIDNFRAGCPGADENSSEVRRYLDILTRVGQATGAIFMVVVHEGKSDPQNPRAASQRVRGSSAITDAAGSVISFVKDGDFIRIEHTRSNLGSPSEPVVIGLVDVGDIDPATKKSVGLRIDWIPIEQVAREAEKPSAGVLKARAAIVATLKKQGTLGKRQLRQYVGGKHDASDTALATLLNDGVIRIENGPNRAKFYTLADREDGDEGE